MLESLIISLVLTVFIEVTVALLLGIRGEKNIETIIWINCITNPVVVGTTNLTYMLSNNMMIRNMVLAILEVAVVFVEGFLIKKYLDNPKCKPYLYAFVLNATSFGLGVIFSFIMK